MAFVNQTFYHGRWSYGPDHYIIDHLNTEQVKVIYSDMFAIWMFAVQIPTVVNFRMYFWNTLSGQ